MKKLLIANRGEIAIRIGQTAAECGLATVAIFPEDDAQSLHVKQTDEHIRIPGSGAQAYLDIKQVINAATATGADAVHPGYGFLSENPSFARACEAAGLVFVGPTSAQLSIFGNKAGARAFARDCGVPLVPGTHQDTSLEDTLAFWDTWQAQGMVIKAIAGGGGRGMRILDPGDKVGQGDIRKLYERCRSEANLAFGNDAVYVEALIRKARHIEVQIIGDGQGNVIHAWERDCSVQRRNQKIIEIAPSPNLPRSTRDKLLAASVTMASRAAYRSLGTFEFLVDADNPTDCYFIEANARLQVEHTVTEAITGLDLVQVQLEVARGRSLVDLGLTGEPPTRGYAIQTRINMETPDSKGMFKPTGGTLTLFEPPSGPGIRTDSYGYAGYRTSTRYDSLLAKLIVHSPTTDFAVVADKARRALNQFRLKGFAVNIPFLATVLGEATFVQGNTWTRYIDQHLAALAEKSLQHTAIQAATSVASFSETQTPEDHGAVSGSVKKGLAGTQLKSTDPLAVLNLGKTDKPVAVKADKAPLAAALDGPPGSQPVHAPLQGTIAELPVTEGDLVYVGQELVVMDAMKMEHVVQAPISGEVVMVTAAVGDAILEDHPIMFIEERAVSEGEQVSATALDLDYIRPDLEEALTRHGYKLDENRPAAVAKRRKTHHRTVRENIQDICDPGTFIEYGSLAIAAQRRRRTVQDLMENTPGDGMVTGIGSVNRALFSTEPSAGLSKEPSIVKRALSKSQSQKSHQNNPRSKIPSASSCPTTTWCWPALKGYRITARKIACSRSPSGLSYLLF